MSAFKSSVMLALLAMFLCLSSTVAAADLFAPGKPVNCTSWADHCKALTNDAYAGKKYVFMIAIAPSTDLKEETQDAQSPLDPPWLCISYSGPSSQCNTTNLAAAQPLCGTNVLCMATFLISLPSTGNTTTGGNSTTNSTGSMYTVGSVDMTSQLLAQYDANRCSGAMMQAAVSFGAMMLVASMTTLFSML
ncbi:hypothetical protein B0O80DRAFT_421318 [Mortierella sp. GBAus27b]|nr:hypothetical protein B0O80DRAFT_421318 [Mortierella sp. GBAus27b]